jgi:hypothetical protein
VRIKEKAKKQLRNRPEGVCLEADDTAADDDID